MNGTIVECNTAYGGSRASTAMHMQVDIDHGFTAIADVDIMDAGGSMGIPVEGGIRLKENFVGAYFANYDFLLMLSHFKGHATAEAAKSVSERLNGGQSIVYVNVMNHLSVDCDCDGTSAEPDMHDIGILASTDPVALDQACVDLVYASEDGQLLINRMESGNGIRTLEHAQALGLCSRVYELVSLDD